MIVTADDVQEVFMVTTDDGRDLVVPFQAIASWKALLGCGSAGEALVRIVEATMPDAEPIDWRERYRMLAADTETVAEDVAPTMAEATASTMAETVASITAEPETTTMKEPAASTMGASVLDAYTPVLARLESEFITMVKDRRALYE